MYRMHNNFQSRKIQKSVNLFLPTVCHFWLKKSVLWFSFRIIIKYHVPIESSVFNLLSYKHMLALILIHFCKTALERYSFGNNFFKKKQRMSHIVRWFFVLKSTYLKLMRMQIDEVFFHFVNFADNYILPHSLIQRFFVRNYNWFTVSSIINSNTRSFPDYSLPYIRKYEHETNFSITIG